jgi:hypothetical protein
MENKPMTLNNEEQLVLEAIKSYLSQDAELGLSMHDKDKYSDMLTNERGFEHLHNNINDLFAVKSADLVHADAVRQAFAKVHSYKYLDDPSFTTAMEKEMVAQAVPANERATALSFIPKIIDQIKEENREWAEKDIGFNKNMEEIQSMSQPEIEDEFDIIDTDLNKKNIDFKVGETKMGRMP